MFDTEKFIGEIEKRPALYNVKLKEYLNREAKAKLWEEIGAEMYRNWHQLGAEKRNKLGRELKIKWKSIRDHFRKELELEKKVKIGKAITIKKRYIYYDQLSFLKSLIQEKTIPTTSQSRRDDDRTPLVKVENTEILENYAYLNFDDQTQVKDKEILHRGDDDCDTTTNSYDERNKITYNAEDPMGNRAFLLSLLPLLDRMPQHSLIYFRYKIMELMHNISQPLVFGQTHNFPSVGILPKYTSTTVRDPFASSPSLSEETQMSENSTRT